MINSVFDPTSVKSLFSLISPIIYFSAKQLWDGDSVLSPASRLVADDKKLKPCFGLKNLIVVEWALLVGRWWEDGLVFLQKFFSSNPKVRICRITNSPHSCKHLKPAFFSHKATNKYSWLQPQVYGKLVLFPCKQTYRDEYIQRHFYTHIKRQ